MSARQLLVPGSLVVKAPQALPASATANLYVVSGAVLVTGLLGRVTTALGATATNLSLGTTNSAAASLATATPITSKPVGTWLIPTGIESIALATPGQPAVPATGVAQQNVNSYPVTVVISANGATITNVSVNGITVGAAAGTYEVPAYGSISIAYSVATPTWVWSNASPAGGVGQLVASAGPAFLGPSYGDANMPDLIAPFLLSADTITWTTSATDTGQVEWYLWYVPIDTSATVS